MVNKPVEIRAILESLGQKPNKRLGQHFLVDQSVLNATIEAAGIKKGDRVLEVGPGLGVLTSELLDLGADVIAIEQDRAFADYLSSHNRGASLNVVQGDAASIHWHELVGQEPWKFVSNLPYSITSLAIRKALYAPHPPGIVVVLIQKEVAERALGAGRGARGAGRTSLLSLMVALASESARIVRKVPPRCFYPAPRVDSVVFEIVPMPVADRLEQWGIDPEAVMQVAKAGFAHPRKLVASNLAERASSRLTRSDVVRRASAKKDIETILESLEVNPKARAEDLAIDDWVALAKRLS